MPRPIGGGIKRCFCLTSVAYIGLNSRTERPIGRLKWLRGSPRHMWLGHHFQGQKVKSQGHQDTLVGCTGRPTQTYSNGDLSIYVHDVHDRVTTAGLQGGGISWRSPAYSFFEMKFCNTQNRIFPSDSLYSPEHFWRRFQLARIFSADKKWRLTRLSATAKGSTVPLTSLIHYLSFMSFSPFYCHHFTRQQRRLPDCRGKKTKRRCLATAAGNSIL